MKFTAVAALALLALAGANAQAGGPRPVVVELYTSQSCSSCPPADALLSKLADRRDVIALSLPITYWDMFGWKDTLASDANTRRQKAYAATMGRGGIYTPQIIIDGTRDVVGSRSEEVEDAIDLAEDIRDTAYDVLELQEDVADIELPAGLTSVRAVTGNRLPKGWSVSVDLKPAGQRLNVAISGAPVTTGRKKLDATIWVLRVRSSATVRVTGGENKGRTLTYRNVVNDIADVGRWRGKAMNFKLPPIDAKTPAHDSLAVIVQQGGYGRVLGAAYLNQATYYARQ